MQDDVDTEVLAELYDVVTDRRDNPREDSYTSSLLESSKGEDAALEKLGEETTELILAVKDQDEDEVAHEAADVVYHLLVVLAQQEIELDLLLDELRERRS